MKSDSKLEIHFENVEKKWVDNLKTLFSLLANKFVEKLTLSAKRFSFDK